MRIVLPQHLPAAVGLPASKSLSARALILAALAETPTPVVGLSDCDDTAVLVRALGVGGETIDIGAAGTAMRFLTAFYSTREGESHILTGTARMQERPIAVLVDALRALGADIEYLGREGFPPLRINGRRLKGGAVSIAADVSSQYISALLMIAPTLEDGLTLTLVGDIASRPYILMTLRLMESFGATATFDGNTLRVAPGTYRRTEPCTIEPDWSAASYWYALVALTPDADASVLLRGLTPDSLQGDSRCAHFFESLGVATAFTDEGAVISKVPSAFTSHPSSFTLPPSTFNLKDTPDLAQTLVVTAAVLGRAFVFSGLDSLRIKETDRIAALIAELRKMGIVIRETSPGVLAYDPADSRIGSQIGSPADSSAAAAAVSAPLTIATYDDHRMAMAFAPAAYRFPGLDIEHPEVVSKSYPLFWHALGLG